MNSLQLKEKFLYNTLIQQAKESLNMLGKYTNVYFLND